MDQFEDHIYVHKVGIEHCLHVVRAQVATLQELNPGTFHDDELNLYMRLWNREEILEERVKTERRQRLLMANPEDLQFLDLLLVIYIHALEKNINAYQAASIQMRRRFGKTEQALKPDLLKLLRDEHAESAYTVGAVDLSTRSTHWNTPWKGLSQMRRSPTCLPHGAMARQLSLLV